MDSEDDFAEFVATQNRSKPNKKSKPKPRKRRGGGGPRASMPVARLRDGVSVMEFEVHIEYHEVGWDSVKTKYHK